MEIRQTAPDDRETLVAVHGLFEAARVADTPACPPHPERAVTGAIANPPPDSEFRCYTGTVDGVLVGASWLYLPTKENRHYAEVELVVHPAHRGRGHGTALLEHLHGVARDEARTELVLLTRTGVEGGPRFSDTGAAFLERRGFTVALNEICRSLTLAETDPEVEQRLWDEAVAAADGYELVSWTGRCPEEYLEGLGRIDSQIFAEIPLGDVDLRPRTVDTQFIRTREDVADALGNAMIRTIAVPKGTKEVVANTLIYAHEGHEHLDQAITIVDPAHRGHRLGLLVKLANLRQVREHHGHATHLWTGNADSNANMVAINDLLGYRPVYALRSYKRATEV